MVAKRQYEPFMVFNARIYGMKNLWNPSTEYKGQPTQKPNYIAGFIVQKTQAHWSQEPAFAGLWGAMQKIYNATMAGTPYEQVEWPIKDGDLPSEPGRQPAEWSKGHWMFGGSSGDPIKVELTQNNALVPLQARANVVKPGDYVILGGATAQKANNPRGIKCYINNVVFAAPGEEIAVGNTVTGAELMQSAQAQGYRPTGFNGAPAGGFGGAPGGGFPGAAAPGGGFGGPGAGGFTPPNGAAPGAGFGNPATQAAPGQFGTAGAGSATFPSNGAFPGAAAPQGPFGR